MCTSLIKKIPNTNFIVRSVHFEGGVRMFLIFPSVHYIEYETLSFIVSWKTLIKFLLKKYIFLHLHKEKSLN